MSPVGKTPWKASLAVAGPTDNGEISKESLLSEGVLTEGTGGVLSASLTGGISEMVVQEKGHFRAR